jgi:hypothetical protein
MRGSYYIQCIEVTSTGARSGQIKVTVQRDGSGRNEVNLIGIYKERDVEIF